MVPPLPPPRRCPPSSPHRAMQRWAWTWPWGSWLFRMPRRRLRRSSPQSCPSGRARACGRRLPFAACSPSRCCAWPGLRQHSARQQGPAGDCAESVCASRSRAECSSRSAPPPRFFLLPTSVPCCPPPFGPPPHTSLQLLRHPQPRLRGQVPDHGQVVLQRAGHGHRVLHHHAPGQG